METRMPTDDDRIDVLLRVLDHPVPDVTAEAIARRASRRGLPLRWAAGVLLALGAAGAAFALPGSPLHRWVVGLAEDRSGGPGAPRTPVPSQEDRGSAGIAVDPGQTLLVVFEGPRTGDVRVTLDDREDLVVRALAGTASFTSENTRLVIGSRDSTGSFSIRIPRAAPRVEIRVRESRLFLKEHERVVSAVTPDSSGVYALRLGAQGP
jgi:hypothetical protein